MGVAGKSVAVIGAGVAGLAAAAALAQRGARVEVFEQAASLAPVGAGLQISPNGMAVLAALGVDVAGLDSQAVELRDFGGARVLRMELGNRYAQPFKLVHRADLIAALERAVRQAGAALHLAARITQAPEAELVVAADGVKSEHRALLNPGSSAFFTGQVAWRAVVPETGLEASAPESTGPEPGAPEAHVYMGPGRHLVTYPLVGGRRNIVAVEEREDWIDEDWDMSDDPATLQAAFAGFADPVTAMLGRVNAVKVWGLFRHKVAERWQDGRLVLIGDAAHPTLPFLAQGANLALEDALQLARYLEDGRQDRALADFEAARKPRVSKAIEMANGNARNYHLSQPVTRRVAHTGLRVVDRVAPGLMLRRFDWLYRFDP